ncbi:class I adenylate-forming enzyme family protein [Halioxenophilus aromaticivorans]|uniref:AMP-binding protein n=1 Tax=Halioxenophilus aromaticivorans TaxID=1306992 RepID=A0AAV3TZQ6_9ALTE
MLIEAITEAYTGNQDKTALIIDEKQWSFEELIRGVRQQADVLKQSGVRQGDRVISLLPNGWHATVMLLACAQIGSTYVPMPLSSTTSALATATAAVSAQHIVLWYGVTETHNEIFANAVVFEVQPDDPLARLVSVGAQVAQASIAPSSIDKSGGTSRRSSTPFILTMTSGSTGAPKPIMLSQATKLLRARAAIATYNLTRTDTTLIATPLYHSLAQRLLLVSLLSGGSVVILPKFTQNLWLASIASYQVTFTIAVSSQLVPLIDLPDAEIAKLASLKTLVSSSALMNLSDKEQLLPRLDCHFHECYGASEVAIVTDVQFGEDSPLGTVGRPLPGVRIKILDSDNKPCATNSVGEICVQSPYHFSGYYQCEAATKAAFDQGFFKTGDLGYVDCRGYLFYAGRKKDVIISGGINIYPNDVEQALESLTGVAEAAAFPVPDDQLGEVVAVALVAEPATILNAHYLRLEIFDRLADYQLPRHWYFVESLPKTALGKLQRFRLAQLHQCRKQPNETTSAGLNS